MSEQETMRLVAELLDKTGGPLAQMQKNIKATSDVANSLHKSGTAQAREHARAYRELQESIKKIKDGAIDVVRPGMESLGITTLSLAGAISAVVSAVKGLGDAGQVLTFTARNSGATVGMIRALGDAGMRFGVSQEAMNAGLAKFGAFMDQNARRAPDALNAWNQMPGAWQRIGRSLVGLSRDTQINKVLDFIPSVKFIDQRRKLLSILGLPEDWANLTREESEKVREAAKRFNTLHPFAMENAKKSKEAWDAIGSSLRGIRDDMGAAFGSDVVRGVEAVQGFLDDKSNIEAFKTGLGDEISKIRKAIKETREELEAFKNIYNWFKDHSIFSDKYPKGDDPMGKDYTRKTAPVNKAFRDLGEMWSPKAAEDATAKGTKQGLEDFYNSLTKQRDSGSYTPMAYHPDGGGSGRGFRSSDGYSVMPDGENAATGGSVPSGSGPTATGATGSKREVAKIVADEWLRAGMSKSGVAGLMANIRDESAFNPNLRHPDQPRFGGEAHFAHGLYQEGGTEWNRFAGWLKQNHPGADWRDPRLQSRFAAENLKKNYPNVWRTMRDNDRFQAAAAYVSGYLKPAEMHRQSRSNKYLSGGVPPMERFTGPMDDEKGSKSVFDTGAPPVRDLLENGKRSGLMGGSDPLNGSASLTIDLNGFPRGTRTASKFDGLFKEVTLNRGRPMSPASETV